MVPDHVKVTLERQQKALSEAAEKILQIAKDPSAAPCHTGTMIRIAQQLAHIQDLLRDAYTINAN